MRAQVPCSGQPSAGALDPPTVVLFEHNPWRSLVGADPPTVAVWENGDIVFLHESADSAAVWQSAIDPKLARELAVRAAGAAGATPRDSSVSSASDGTTVELVARDAAGWHTASVYGLGRPEPGDHADDSATAPAEFVSAYAELLRARPSTGTELVPADLEVVFWGFDDAGGSPVLWPSTVPPPPRDAVPVEREPGDPTAYTFVVPASHLAALRAMNGEARANGAPRGIGFNGHKWSVALIPRYRGQAVIDAFVRCTRSTSP